MQRAEFEQKGSDYVPKKKAKSKKKAAGVLTKQEKELGWGGFDDKLAANKVGFAHLFPAYCLLGCEMSYLWNPTFNCKCIH